MVKKHPYGSFYTEESLKSITLSDVSNFYKTYFSPANAYMVVVGDVNTAQVEELVSKYFHEWWPAKSLQMTTPTPQDVQYTQVNLVDVPTAVQTEISAFNLYPLKMSDKDYFAVRVLNQILEETMVAISTSTYVNSTDTPMELALTWVPTVLLWLTSLYQ